MHKRNVPELDPVATASGVALSIVVSIGVVFLGFPPITALVGVVAGGYLAGRLAGRDGLYHGALVGVLTIIAASFASSAGNDRVNNIWVDTLTIVVSDVLLLVSASVGGWFATRS